MIIRLCLDQWWIEKSREWVQPPVFLSINPPRRGFQAGMAVSLLVHFFLVVVLFAVARGVFLAESEEYHPIYVYRSLSLPAMPVGTLVRGRVFKTAAAAPWRQGIAHPRSNFDLPPTRHFAALAEYTIAQPVSWTDTVRVSDLPKPEAPATPPAAPTYTSSTELLPDGCVRITHPKDGVNDVVIEQSSPSDLPAAVAGVLTGRPVHTVFLNVGAPKEWSVHYCLPYESSLIEVVNSMVIRLPNPARLSAPYPMVTVLPPAAELPVDRSTLIYGLLDASGRLTALRVVEGRAEETTLLGRLADWLFRPASRDGAPVQVEFVLTVPASPGQQPQTLGAGAGGL